MTPLRSESLAIETYYAARGSRVLKLSGPITLQTLFEFQQVGREDADKPVVLDLSEVTYMDSAGLGCVLGMFVSCEKTKRGFALIGLTERVRTLLKVTHVDGLLPNFHSLDEAEAAIVKPAV